MPARRSPKPARASFISRWVVLGVEAMQEAMPHVSAAVAEQAMNQAADAWTAEMAGRDLYVPANKAAALTERDAGIRAAFSAAQGSSGAAAAVAELGRVHNLSARRVRSIVRAIPRSQPEE